MPEPRPVNLTPEQAAEIRQASEHPRYSAVYTRLRDAFGEILQLESDGITGWLEAPTDKLCACGSAMCRFEALNGRCEPCRRSPAEIKLTRSESCPCGHFSHHGWHRRLADSRTVSRRCKSYWQARGFAVELDEYLGYEKLRKLEGDYS